MGANRRQSHWSRYGGTRMTIRRWPVGGGIGHKQAGKPAAVYHDRNLGGLERTGPIWPEDERPTFAKNRAFGVVRGRKFKDEAGVRGDPRWRIH